jgi:hypothetical protein
MLSASVQRASKPTRKQRRNSAGDNRWRHAVPMAMPHSAGSSIHSDSVHTAPDAAPPICSPAANANVETVNEMPIAWISWSLLQRSACRYGTTGITKTPVAAVTSPVAAPTMGPMTRSLDGVIDRRLPARPQAA